MTVGKKIKEARNAAGLTQKQLGKKLNVTQASINQFENNLRNPKLETLTKIAAALDVTLVDLLDVPTKPDREALEQLPGTIKHDADGRTYKESFLYSSESLKRNQVVQAYDTLNQVGQAKLLDYGLDLVEIPRYIKQSMDANTGKGGENDND